MKGLLFTYTAYTSCVIRNKQKALNIQEDYNKDDC